MGVLISLEDHRRARETGRTARVSARAEHHAGDLPATGDAPVSARERTRVELFFDLGDPFSYLAAERVERSFEAVTWTPVTHVRRRRDVCAPGVRGDAETRAHALRMPLVWPERFPEPVTRAMRAASLAAERGRGAAFALAAGRLAFCGGFDLDDPEILAEAAAAAGVGLEAVLEAAGDRARDSAMAMTGRRLRAAGADRLPVLRVGTTLFCGEERIAEAAAAARFALSAGG
ncbi:MAG TPA: DsbA family protein [Solirubrobacteraceae bacterium]|jgi:2-hydroxychromene-2-carboxylate isomerase